MNGRLYGIAVVAFVGICFLILATIIRSGNTGIIHSYHRKNVKEKDKMAYARDVSKGLYIMAASMVLSCIFMYFQYMCLFGTSLFAGMGIGAVHISKAQKKYNGGWFS